MKEEKNSLDHSGQMTPTFDSVFESNYHLFSINLREIWKFRDLLVMMIKRDFVTYYKQTVLGPLWFFIQPIFTTAMYVIVFGNVAKLSTDGAPQIIFYLSGITGWNYFSECLNKTATVFRDNQAVFGKVYFPRIITPISIVISNLIKYGIQLGLFVIFLVYYIYVGESVRPNMSILLVPILTFIMAGTSLGFGMIFASLTTKYRDLTFLLQFGIQLFMYATPVIYPLSAVPEKFKIFSLINPMTGIIETFRYAFLGTGSLDWFLLTYDFIFMIIIMLIGIIIFNHREKSFIDTV